MRFRLMAIFASVFITAFDGWATEQPKDDGKAIQGNWEVTTHLPDTIPPAKYERLVFKGDKLIFYSRIGEKQDIVQTKFKLDPKADPKEIDFTPLEGGNKDKTYVGLYDLTDGKLIIAYRGPGEKRPMNLNAKQKGNEGVTFIYLVPEPEK